MCLRGSVLITHESFQRYTVPLIPTLKVGLQVVTVCSEMLVTDRHRIYVAVNIFLVLVFWQMYHISSEGTDASVYFQYSNHVVSAKAAGIKCFVLC